MIIRGTLEISEGSARVRGLHLATGTLDELGVNRAVEVLYSKGLFGGEEVSVNGTQYLVAGQRLLMMSDVWSNSSLTLAGNPVGGAASVQCKQCGTVNSVPFVDPHDPPYCENQPPKHKLKIS